ncbi:hypothetical protein PI124_g4303 [Phytophthora idaei]|nr:hypothetical protein PI125_g4155 [Phytophthora idaei]KAG3159472.1 hypothetical protein PI126_g7368 [Phytophthora idaei]KAG3251048.1 hypothetical protein PI124_g4303 [Phytophthora idaei]
MNDAFDESKDDGATVPVTALAADRERIGMADENEDQSTTMVRERGNGNTIARDRGDGTVMVRERGNDTNTDGQAPTVRTDDASELLALMRGITGRLERLEESQTKLEKRLDVEKDHAAGAGVPMSPSDSSLFASRLS